MSWMLNQKSVALDANQKVLRAKEKGLSIEVPNTDTGSAPDNVWKVAVRMDMEKIKEIPDHDDRIPLKEKLLEKYRDYLVQFMQISDEKSANDALFLNMIWAGDAGQYDWMLALTDYAEKTQQPAVKPWFKRPPAAATAHSILQKTEIQYKKERTLPEIFKRIFEKIMADEWKVNPFTKAHYHRLMGLDAIISEQWDFALDNLIIADELKDDIGVKGRITTLKEGSEDQKKALSKKEAKKK